ncbi:SDR family NAD(P)-dependent oxidoreductase [Fimbriimonas ginsengisoli]|uniref:NAD dependent epimerase/dehydratase family protein n=1 Tax=Fimbriimonas ginsengisoli Gsoil 348 TaxID=661478 RepID=A0A068NT95_FIMGI|nr:SDR family NAD(P)-dependent oxidoreductase [Fimbriimonas ginsengisoli]AIE86646.1 NAD dependent epimerase/dehydratase family protein [Fimbriimonas ginsengisoli Gsoil 348]
MSWQGRTVLVTGAGGFIGSHLAENLVKAGAKVRAMVHYNFQGSWGWLEESELKNEMEIVAGDIMDRDSVKGAMEGREVVFHLAALIAIPYSYRAPQSYVNTNVTGTLNVVQAARELGTSRILHTSTSEVYGTARIVPIDEEHPLQGQSPYSASKIGADKIAESFYLSFGTPVVTVRPFNTFGPRQSARAVIPTIISQCLSGKVVKLGATSPTRDLNYVQNTVEGFMAAGLADAAIGETINFGSGREISVGELAQLIARLCGREVEIQTEAERLRPDKSEVERLLAANEKAKRLTGWTPGVSLEEGLERTIAWFETNLHRYRPHAYNV